MGIDSQTASKDVPAELVELAWKSLKDITGPIKDPELPILSSETPDGAEDHISEQFAMIRAMIAAVDARDLDALKACVADDAIVFAYTTNIRMAVRLMEEGY